MTAQVAADLRAAADVLRRDGWTQEDFEDEVGRHCAMGAVEVAVGDDWERRAAAKVALSAHVGIGAVTWNDEPGRTADEVIAALEAAADAAEAKS